MKLIIFLIIVMIFVVPTALADTFPFQYTAATGNDTWMRDGMATDRSTSATLTIGNSAGAARSLLDFEIDNGSIPSGSTINSIKIQFELESDYGGSSVLNIRIYPVILSWVEAGMNKWTAFNNGGVNITDYNGSLDLITAFLPASPTDDNHFNVTINPIWGQEKLDGTLVYDKGLIIIDFIDEGTGGAWVGIDSTDSATAADIWEVIVDFTLPADITPPVVTIDEPTNNTALSQTFINFTVTVTDDESNNIICVLGNESEVLDEDTVTSGAVFNLTYDAETAEIQQTNLYNITCYDNDATNNNSLVAWMNITLDTILPSLTINLPINNSVIDKTFNNLSVDILCTDPNIIALNASLIDMDGAVVWSVQNNTAGSEMIIDNATTLSSVLTGNYNMNITCADGHTYYDSKVKEYIKDEILNKVYYVTESGNDVSIQMFYSSLTLCDFGSKSGADREMFWYDFRSCNPKSKGINTYKFMLRDNDGKLRYLPKSNYKAHFVTDENFATFQLDEPAIYSARRIKDNYEITIYTQETFLDFRNSIGGNNFVRRFLNLSIIQTNFTSMNHFDFLFPTVTIDSDTFVTVFNITANLTIGQHLTLKGSGVIKKVTQPQSTEVSGRLIVNNEVLFEGSLLSTSDVVPFNLPIQDVDLIAGQNNISLEISESAQGAINLTNFIIEGDTDMSAHGKDINHSHNNETLSLTSSSFVNIFNVSINKSGNSSSLIDFQHRVANDGAGATTLVCYAESNSTGEITPSYYSYMQSSGDSGNAGTAYASRIKTTGTETWMLHCRTDNGNQITNTIHSYVFVLSDIEGNIINNLQNVSSSISGLTAGETLFMESSEFQHQNATEVDIIVTIAVQSTSGVHSEAMTFKVNSSTANEDDCIGLSETNFINSDDARTVKFYFSCESGIREFVNITAYATLATGETANILNVSLTGFEVTDQPVSIINIPPIVVINSPPDNTILHSINKIEWTTSEVNNWTTNITAINSSVVTLIEDNIGDDIGNISFDFTTLGEGEFTINVTSTENLTSPALSGTDTITITVQFPFISLNLSSPANNSVDDDGRVIFSFRTDTGNSNNCSLFIDNTINFANQSINATVGLNSFSEVQMNNGTHTWLVRCDNSTHQAVSAQWIINTEIPDPNALSLTVCPNTITGVFILVLLVFTAIMFILMALITQLGFIGVFGSVMLMISSWFISPCSNIFAYAVALLSIILMLWFIVNGFFGRKSEG